MTFQQFFKELFQDVYSISYTLFKIMIPVIIVVKILEELGGIKYLGYFLEPLMTFVGLPESMGLVWATTLLTNIYGGMVIFVSQVAVEPMTVAQVTVLGGMMLIAHGLPIEVRIAQKAGMSVWFSLFIRIGGGIFYGWLLFVIYRSTDWLQQPHQLAWQPNLTSDADLTAWVIGQLQSFLMILLIIFVLMFFLKVLKLIGVERLLAIFLRPILRLLGISHTATSITIVGITLGLTFGGGLLIAEAKAGHVSKKDVFTAMALIAVLHSLIEDTALILLLGADISGVLWFRLVFSIVFVGVLSRIILKMDDETFARYFSSNSLKGDSSR